MTNRHSFGTSLRSLVGAAKGLAHPARLRMLAMLSAGELCVCQLTAMLGLAPSTVSRHLAVLAAGDLVGERKAGKLVLYRLAEGAVAEALLAPLLAQLANDPTVVADADVLARLRQVPIAELCAAELDLAAVGVLAPPAHAVVAKIGPFKETER
jgi:arsenate reductase/ArsR family transcriptional regulator